MFTGYKTWSSKPYMFTCNILVPPSPHKACAQTFCTGCASLGKCHPWSSIASLLQACAAQPLPVHCEGWRDTQQESSWFEQEAPAHPGIATCSICLIHCQYSGEFRHTLDFVSWMLSLLPGFTKSRSLISSYVWIPCHSVYICERSNLQLGSKRSHMCRARANLRCLWKLAACIGTVTDAELQVLDGIADEVEMERLKRKIKGWNQSRAGGSHFFWNASGRMRDAWQLDGKTISLWRTPERLWEWQFRTLFGGLLCCLCFCLCLVCWFWCCFVFLVLFPPTMLRSSSCLPKLTTEL